MYNIGLGLTVSVSNYNTGWSEKDFFECVEENYYKALENATGGFVGLCWHPAFTSLMEKIPDKSKYEVSNSIKFFLP